jgi:spermidine/putrescine transport system ATP-binding protein
MEIYERPHNRFVADFIGETNFMEGQVLEVDPAKTTVGLGAGVQVLARPVNGLATGQIVTVAVRPEKISLYAAAPANGVNVPAVVEEAVYIGTDTRYKVKVGDHHHVVARVQNVTTTLEDPHLFQRGDRVYLSWPMESALVLTS